MELTCLNCTGTFTVGDADPAGRSSLVCPLCGREQRWVGQGDFQEPSIAPASGAEAVKAHDEAPRGESASGSGTFRRPMQAFSGLRGAKAAAVRPGAPQPVQIVDPKATASAPVGSVIDALPPEPGPSGGLGEVPGLGDVVPVPASTEAWTVRSPSGLVLEFPAANLLLAWSAVIDNPAPYSVSHAGSLWTPLDELIRELKRGKRSTQAFLKTLDGGAVPGLPAIDPVRRDQMELGMPLQQAIGAPSASGGTPQRAIPTTSQFQFKIAESKPAGMPGWVILLLVTVGVLGAAGIAAYFLLLH